MIEYRDSTLIWVLKGINQSDAPERQSQVKQMYHIYQNAKEVIGWLGPDEDGGADSLRVLQHLVHLAHGLDKGSDLETFVRRLPQLCSVNPLGGSQISEEALLKPILERLQALMERPYWRRVWIVQEFALAQKLFLACGSHSMEAKVTEISAILLVDNASLAPITADIPGLQAFQKIQFHWWTRLLSLRGAFMLKRRQSQHSTATMLFKRDHFFDLLTFTLRYQTTDPRDKLFGLLGLSDVEIMPDYEASVRTVYIDYAKHCIREGRTEFLCRSGNQDIAGWPASADDLPSWVPDWSLISHGSTPKIVSGSVDTFPSYEAFRPTVTDSGALLWRGTIVDVVDGVQVQESFNESHLLERQTSSQSWDSWYPSGMLRLQALVLLAVQGRFPRQQRPDAKSAAFCECAKSFLKLAIRHFGETMRPEPSNASEVISAFKAHYQISKDSDILIPLFLFTQHHLEELKSADLEDFLDPEAVAFGNFIKNRMTGRTYLLYSKEGYVGFGPPGTKEGDFICGLEGFAGLLVLRKEGSHYVNVGYCYVVGLMDGEIPMQIDEGMLELSELEIH